MKVISTLAFLFFVTCALVAQPVINRGHLLAPGDEVYLVNVEDVPVRGEAGADVHWDFGDVVPDPEVIRIEVADPDTTPYAEDFPDANQALVIHEIAGQVYQYNMVNNDSWNELGSVISDFSRTVYQNQATFLQFPLTYSAQWQDDYAHTTEFDFNPVDIITEGSLDVTVDAYGSLTFPHVAFDDVLRVCVVDHSVDTASLGQGLSERNDYYDTIYIWFSPSYRGPLAILDFGRQVTTVYLISGDTTITDQETIEYMSFSYDPMSEPTSSVKDYVKPGRFQLDISPNPFDRVLHLAFVSEANREMQLILRDLFGRTIWTGSIDAGIGENNLRIDLPEIPSGTYVALLQTTEGADVQKLLRIGDIR